MKHKKRALGFCTLLIVIVLGIMTLVSYTRSNDGHSQYGRFDVQVEEKDGIRTVTSFDDKKSYTYIYDKNRNTIQYIEKDFSTGEVASSEVLNINERDNSEPIPTMAP